MDATDRIAEEFDRLVIMGRDGVAQRPVSERIVYYVVATRCLIDIDGFASVYEQDLNPTEIATLIGGLSQIGETELADAFSRGFELLKHDGFYKHMNWNMVSDPVKSEIEMIGTRVGDRLWSLDDKLSTLLDSISEHGKKR